VEITQFLQADKYQRTEKRCGYRNGYKPRKLKTRVGTLELLFPRIREGRFQTQLFAQDQRSEKALVSRVFHSLKRRGLKKQNLLSLMIRHLLAGYFTVLKEEGLRSKTCCL